MPRPSPVLLTALAATCATFVAPVASLVAPRSAPPRDTVEAHPPVSAAPVIEPARVIEPRRRILAAGGDPVEVYAPIDREHHARLLVMLHGACTRPAFSCDFWAVTAQEHGLLVCPTANGRCGDHFSDWTGPSADRVAALDDDLRAVDAAQGARIDRGRCAVLMGFSRGAWVARDYVHVHPGRFRGVVLMSAEITVDPARFRAAGVARAVLAAGDLDGSAPVMRHAARVLSAGGVPARFFSLGAVGHSLGDFGATLPAMLRWIDEGCV